MRASLTVLALGLLLLATAPLAGCGLKGELYLPEEESTAPAPQPGAGTRSEDESEEDESPASPPGA